MRARNRATGKQVLGGKRECRHRGGLGAFTVAFLVAALLVTGLAASSASASPPSVKRVTTWDVLQLRAPAGLHQLDSGSLRTLPGGAAGLFPIVPEPSSARAAGDIFYDGFETANPPWQVGGDPTWAGWDYRAAAGSQSAYCAGSAIQPPGPYANNMTAWLWTGPINLTGLTAATFQFKLYLDSEYEHDYLKALVSLDDENYYGSGWTGSTGGAWVTESIDLTAVPTLGNVCGHSAVYIAFIFESDASTTTDEGAYIDEVRVSGSQPPATATITSLTPTHAQTGASVVIAGSNLGASGTVRFGSTSATTSAWSATSITATVPASLPPGSVSVSVTPTGGSVSNALSFAVDPPSGLLLAQWVISGQPLTVKYGGYATIRGTLSDAISGVQLANRRAGLYWTDDPTDYDSWILVGELDPAPGTGEFTMVVGRVVSRTYFSWWFPGDGQYAEQWSGDVKIMSRANLSRPGFPLKVRHGKRVTAVGTLKPQHSAAQNRQSHTKVYIYRYSSGKYRLVGKYWAKAYNTSSVTKYSLRFVFHKAGKHRARAVHEDDDHAKTTSSWRTFRVL